MSADFFKACEWLLSATANGVYQGILVALAAGLALRLCARTNAATRYAVWFGVMLFIAALIPAHLLLSYRPHALSQSEQRDPGPVVMAYSIAPFDFDYTSELPVSDADFPAGQLAEMDSASVNVAAEPPVAAQPAAEPRIALAADERSEAKAEKKAQSVFPPAILRALMSRLEAPFNLPHSICLCLVSAWALLAGIRGGMVGWQLIQVRRAKKTSIAPSRGLQEQFVRLRVSLGATRDVRVAISSAHRCAVVLGFFDPVVLLPAEMDGGTDEAEVEHVLRHELAHVERRDDWGNLVQQAIQAAFFFHPAVWWIAPKLSLEREIACDDHVLEAKGRPRAYALTLANVASRINHCRQLLAPGVSNNNSQLQQRITMILNTQRDRSTRLAGNRLGFFTAATAVVAALTLTSAPRLVLAQSPAAEPAVSESVAPEQPDLPSVEVRAAVQAEVPAVATVLVAPAGPTSSSAAVLLAAPAAEPPNWSENESGPRPKALVSPDDATVGVNPPDSAPMPPTAPAAAGVPSAPVVVSVAPVPPMYLVAPNPPDSRIRPGLQPMKKHMSIEDRLDRIERILDDLEKRGDLKGRRHGEELFKFDSMGKLPKDDFPKSDDAMRQRLDSDFARSQPAAQAQDKAFAFQFGQARATADAQRAQTDALGAEQDRKQSADEALLAVKEGQRAVDEGRRRIEEGQRAVERAARDMARQAKDFGRLPDDASSGSEAQAKALEALRNARESLESQVKSLEKQIKRLEGEQNSPKKPGRSDDSDDQSKDGKTVTPQTS